MKMSRNEAHRTIIQMLESDAPLCVVENIARENDIVLTEIWENDDIIGMMVDDITVYY